MIVFGLDFYLTFDLSLELLHELSFKLSVSTKFSLLLLSIRRRHSLFNCHSTAPYLYDPGEVGEEEQPYLPP